jgi:2-phosphosulfolactate phosphatase
VTAPVRVHVARGPAAAGAAAGPAAAGAAPDSVVVIDVLRAFTTAAHAFHAGATEIWLCRGSDEAFALRGRAPGAVLVGEAGGQKIPGFDHGNSPSELQAADLRGRVVILRSSNGTLGVDQAARASAGAEILLGSLVVAAATARYLRRIGGAIDLVPMGWIGEPPRVSRDHLPHAVSEDELGSAPESALEGAEDHACAAYLAALLTGAPVDVAATIRAVAQSPAGRRALDPAVPWITSEDLACAAAVDRFDFAMPVTRRGDLLVAHAVPAPSS